MFGVFRQRLPVPGEQFVEPWVDVVVDARQHVSQIGLRVEMAHLGAFDQRHRAGQRFAAGVATGE